MQYALRLCKRDHTIAPPKEGVTKGEDMTSINGLLSGNLFSDTTKKTSTNQTTQTNGLLSATQTGTNSGELSSYMLDLSEAAKAYLAQQSTQSQATTSGDGEHFALTEAQQEQIRKIIEQYKNAPLTEETFAQIQDELTAIGLGADQLAAKEQVSAFNPLQSFLDALSGTSTTLSSEDISASVSTKRENYLSDIIDYWASISTAESDNVSAIDA